MSNIKEKVLRNWHFMRWFRLAMAIFIGYQAISILNIWLGFMSLIFLYQALFNTGCCCGNTCTVEPDKKK